MAPVHFFDIKSKLEGSKRCWSPNTLKARVVLNYKGIPYTQTYISYPDISGILDSLGHAPDDSKPAFKGQTCPAIYHPESLKGKTPGDQVLTEAMDIVLHLDEIYPEKPAFPSIEGSTREQTIALAQKVQDLFVKCRTDGHLGQIAMPHIPGILDEPGSEYFIRTRSSMPPFHKSPLEWASEDPEDDWKHFEPSLKPIADVLSEKPGPFCLGETFSYADAIILGQLGWMESCDQKYLERICKMHGGAFGRIWDKAMKEGWVEGQGEDKEWPLK